MGYRFDSERHIHSLNDLPLHGTTTVLQVISKPLTWWASGEACKEFGWIHPDKATIQQRLDKATEFLTKFKDMKDLDYLRLLDKAYRAHKDNLDKSADAGTDLHTQVERYIQNKLKGIEMLDALEFDVRLAPFIEWCNRNVTRFLWTEKCHYSEKYWTGGKSDFGYEDKQGKTVLGDIKSAKEAYFSHFVQAGAYDLQISENGLFEENGAIFRGALKIDYYSIFPFGKPFVQPTVVRHLENYRLAFINALQLYKSIQDFEKEKV